MVALARQILSMHKNLVAGQRFGMLDKADYQRNMLNKMHIYTSNNILPGIHLITTYETNEKPLTFEIIEMYIQYYFM